jgi:hypothetical protein
VKHVAVWSEFSSEVVGYQVHERVVSGVVPDDEVGLYVPDRRSSFEDGMLAEINQESTVVAEPYVGGW